MLFARLAQPFICSATTQANGLRLIFDLEADGLLETIRRIHCIVIEEADSDRRYEYGPDHITEALTHLARADELIGHNIQSYDLPVLRKLHGWDPRPGCRITDTLIAGRLILPNLASLDGEVTQRAKSAAFSKIRGRYSLEAWGIRLGVGKVGADLAVWAEWMPEIQARCAGDVVINKRLWQFLRIDGYSRAALDLEYAAAAVCGRITTDGAPFDITGAARLHQEWSAKRAAFEARLRTPIPRGEELQLPRPARKAFREPWLASGEADREDPAAGHRRRSTRSPAGDPPRIRGTGRALCPRPAARTTGERQAGLDQEHRQR
jgi:hypothetical protein